MTPPFPQKVGVFRGGVCVPLEKKLGESLFYYIIWKFSAEFRWVWFVNIIGLVKLVELV